MSLSKQLINDFLDIVTQKDMIQYGLDQCQNIEQLEKYQIHINQKIDKIINANDPIRKLLVKIDEVICTPYCRDLTQHFLHLQRNMTLLHDNLPNSIKNIIISQDPDKIREWVENNKKIVTLVEYIYGVCSNMSYGYDMMPYMYYDNFERNLKDIFINFYIQEGTNIGLS